MKINKRLIFSTVALILFMLTIYAIFKLSPLEENISIWITNSGDLGIYILGIIQFLQVIIIPIPANFIILAGLALFTPLQVFIVSTIAICVGSVVNYVIGRIWGIKVVRWIAKDKADKYIELLSRKSKFLIPFMFIFAGFPDDLICIAAGSLKISFIYFTLCAIITRPIGIASLCFGIGFIPFSGWGIPIWIAIVLIIGTIMYLAYKYQDIIVDKLTHKKRE